MSGSPLTLIDQTLTEGLRRKVSPAKLQQMQQLLQEMGVIAADVGVTDWERYGSSASEALERANLRGRVRASGREVQKAAQLGFARIVCSYRFRSGDGIGRNLVEALAEARAAGIEVAVHLENASGLSLQEIKLFNWELLANGVHTLIYGDADSRLDPFSTYDALAALTGESPLLVEFHAHNAHGLATANTLAALRAGAVRAAVSVCGIGGNGHAATEEIIMGSRYFYGSAIELRSGLAAACRLILSSLNLDIPVNKAVVGSGIFAHESGIHVDGVVKDPRLYEAFRPEEVGLYRTLVIGKHSGTAALKDKFQTWGIILEELEAKCLLEKVRTLAVGQKCHIDDVQLKQLYQSLLTANSYQS